MNILNLIQKLKALHHDCIIQWKQQGVVLTQCDFLQPVEENHSFNFLLWHAEDRARRNDKGAEFVYQAKREIDGFNQQRNNRMETMDTWLFNLLQPSNAPNCPIHSETPGMIIDRLSILALKAYHMALQANRQEVDAAHRQSCQQKLTVIQLQQNQLYDCLQQLLHEIIQKNRTFRVYHQFKMYNDPKLNPELYTSNVL